MTNRGRNPKLERRVLSAIARHGRRRFGVDCQPYVAAVERRLKVGANRYGDDAFLGRDNLAELLEETPDVGAYSVLELQRLAGSAHPEVRDDLLRAVLLGAVADHYARRARRRLKDGGAG